jgi:D-beta-D-heptose 7-phosphate kinase/D-beta-D-heptose 1-phosphate adenosyltransferase
MGSAQTLAPRYSRPREERLVFTNGCFDLLHRGHVEYLDAARHLGDRLVVGLNSDASVRRLKGAGRPVVPEDDRAYVLAGLEAIDHVVLFAEDTPLDLIRLLRPDVIVKGGDYDPAEVVGAEQVIADGGRVVILPFVPGRSTTSLLARIPSDNPAKT